MEDPTDTDLEHAPGGALIVASDDPVNSPDLLTLGAYIVSESSENAYHVFSWQLQENDGERLGSTSFAGTKAWIMTLGEMMLTVMRIGYVMIIAADTMAQQSSGKGLIEHLDIMARAIS